MNKKLRSCLMLAVTMWPAISGFAAQEFRVASQGRVEAYVSSYDINRINVLNDRISRVYGTAELFHHDFDEVTGQVFIKPKFQLNKPFTITLVTENRATIDMLLSPRDMEAATILLIRDDKDQGDAGVIKGLIKSVLRGEAMKGFRVLPEAGQSEPSTVQVLKQYQSQKHSIKLLSFKNTSAKPVVLSEQQFHEGQSVKAITIEKKNLKPNESTRIVVVADLVGDVPSSVTISEALDPSVGRKEAEPAEKGL